MPETSPTILPEMNETLAHEILHTVASTPIPEGTKIETQIPYSIPQVVSAIAFSTEQVMKKNNIPKDQLVKTLSIRSRSGSLHLMTVPDTKGMVAKEVRQIMLEFRDFEEQTLLKITVPIGIQEGIPSTTAIGFIDKRGGSKSVLGTAYEENDSEKNLFVWKGIRWMCANIGNWGNGILLPEDLDPPQLPAQSVT